jgi:hypothetical protein
MEVTIPQADRPAQKARNPNGGRLESFRVLGTAHRPERGLIRPPRALRSLFLIGLVNPEV